MNGLMLGMMYALVAVGFTLFILDRAVSINQLFCPLPIARGHLNDNRVRRAGQERVGAFDLDELCINTKMIQ